MYSQIMHLDSVYVSPYDTDEKSLKLNARLCLIYLTLLAYVHDISLNPLRR